MKKKKLIGINTFNTRDIDPMINMPIIKRLEANGYSVYFKCKQK